MICRRPRVTTVDPGSNAAVAPVEACGGRRGTRSSSITKSGRHFEIALLHVTSLGELWR
jgi:hypothetical protein